MRNDRSWKVFERGKVITRRACASPEGDDYFLGALHCIVHTPAKRGAGHRSPRPTPRASRGALHPLKACPPNGTASHMDKRAGLAFKAQKYLPKARVPPTPSTAPTAPGRMNKTCIWHFLALGHIGCFGSVMYEQVTLPSGFLGGTSDPCEERSGTSDPCGKRSGTSDPCEKRSGTSDPCVK
eukprot:gene17286-biopygen15886